MSDLFLSIAQHTALTPDKSALAGTSLNLSYAQLSDAIQTRQEDLRKRQIKTLGLIMENGPEWILWDLAALRAGVVLIPIPPFFTDQQKTFVISAAGIDTILTKDGFQQTGASGIPFPKNTCKITFTSGTTGTPKGVCLSQEGIEQVARSLVSVIGKSYAQDHLSVMPLPILLENVAGVYACLMAGGCVHIPDAATIGMENPFKPDFAKLARAISALNITSVILVPELLRGLMAVAAVQPDMFSPLQFVAVGGSKVSPALIDGARALGLPVYEGYGLSECGSVVSLNTPSQDHPGSAGKILPHIDMGIEDGEIIIHNPVYLGYLGGDGKKGSFSTGDLGHIADDGTLYITGRKKNIIITSQGRNISPEWLESLLLAQPEIAQAMVYGDELPFPEALIVPMRENINPAQALARVNEQLPVYARIAAFQIVPPFSVQNGMLTGTGRPKRDAIRSFYQSIITEEKDHVVLRNARS